MMPETTSTVAIIQARLGSARLPKKVIRNLAGEPMLAHVVNRSQRASTLDRIVIATTTEQADGKIEHLCRKEGWLLFRGSENDVLDRYYQAALVFKASIVVRITSDCPLIEPEIIDKVVGEFLHYFPSVDYASNTIVRTFPRGLDVEVFSFDALERAHKEAKKSDEREHVTPYIRRHPEIFRIRNVANDVDYSSLRWTVDTIEDLTFVRKIYSHFQNSNFTWREVLHLLGLHPEWLEINRHIQQKVVL